MSTPDSGRYNDLKARVKAECLRRAHTGSVASYGGSAYDYTAVPAAGRVVKREHKAKLAEPLSAINKNTIPASMASAPLVSDGEMTRMEAFVTVCEKRGKTDSTGTDCAASCTGLCYGCVGTCTGTCDGCSGCGGSCSYDCWGCDGCSGCGSGCADGCDGGCDGGCSGCGSACIDDCEYDCYESCWGCYGCGAGCASTCSGDCTGKANI